MSESASFHLSTHRCTPDYAPSPNGQVHQCPHSWGLYGFEEGICCQLTSLDLDPSILSLGFFFVCICLSGLGVSIGTCHEWRACSILSGFFWTFWIISGPQLDCETSLISFGFFPDSFTRLEGSDGRIQSRSPSRSFSISPGFIHLDWKACLIVLAGFIADWVPSRFFWTFLYSFGFILDQSATANPLSSVGLSSSAGEGHNRRRRRK